MNAVLSIGKYLYAIPFAVFGIFHFMNAEAMKGIAFGSPILVYLTGAALIAGAVSLLIGKLDKLAAVLLAVFLLLTAFLVHLDAAMQGDASSFLKDLMLAGAALMYAGNLAKDNAVIG
ncbi:MAG: DoxX family membrane protein [Phaeodactylibacter sp.]|nr:DoxX family membrane protein [Phaeodactylibacter sp.]